MLRKLVLLTLFVLLCALPISGVMAQDGITSVCLVTDIGKVNDGTFNQFAYEGMMMAVEEFDLETTFIETTAQTDYAANINTCVDEGFQAIVTVGFMIEDGTYAAAEANPDIYFIGVDQGYFGKEPLDNLVGIQYREDQAGFLVGAMAALMTESGKIAGVYGIDIPPVVKFRNGFEQGAKFINPDIELMGVYIDSFTAPDRGAAAAEQFMGEGADVIFGAGGPTGSGGIKRAAEEGVKVIGVDQDEYFTTFGEGETPGAENLITSAQKRVDQGVYDMIAALVGVEGKEFIGGGQYILQASNNGIGFAPAHDAKIPANVVAQVQELLVGLKNGWLDTGVDPASGEMLAAVDFEAQVVDLQTQLETAQSDLVTAQSDLETAKADLETANASLQTAQTELEAAQGPDSTLIIVIIVAALIIAAGAYMGLRQRGSKAA